jgi:hypothetical protein
MSTTMTSAVAQDFARHNPELHTLGGGLQTGRTMIVFSRVLIVLNAVFDLIGDVRTPKRSAKPDFPGAGAAATDRWGPLARLGPAKSRCIHR